MKDMSNSVATAVSIKNAVKTSAENGTGVDLQGYESATVFVDVGAENVHYKICFWAVPVIFFVCWF